MRRRIVWEKNCEILWVGEVERTPFYVNAYQQMVGTVPGKWMLSVAFDPDGVGLVWPGGKDAPHFEYDTVEEAIAHAPDLLASLATFLAEVATELGATQSSKQEQIGPLPGAVPVRR